jgi:hypothetical protein
MPDQDLAPIRRPRRDQVNAVGPPSNKHHCEESSCADLSDRLQNRSSPPEYHKSPIKHVADLTFIDIGMANLVMMFPMGFVVREGNSHT